MHTRILTYICNARLVLLICENQEPHFDLSACLFQFKYKKLNFSIWWKLKAIYLLCSFRRKKKKRINDGRRKIVICSFEEDFSVLKLNAIAFIALCRKIFCMWFVYAKWRERMITRPSYVVHATDRTCQTCNHVIK